MLRLQRLTENDIVTIGKGGAAYGNHLTGTW